MTDRCRVPTRSALVKLATDLQPQHRRETGLTISVSRQFNLSWRGACMALTLSMNQLGKPELEKPLRNAVDEFFKQYPGDWQVTIIGSLDSAVWEMRVSASAGDNSRAKNLSAKDGGHNVEKVVSEIRRMADLLSQTGPAAGQR